MAQDPCVLSIDLGTSGPKCAVVSLSGALLGTGRASVATLYDANGAAEQDAEAIWQATSSAITQALAAAALPAGALRGVICSSQYSSVVPVDAKGAALTRFMVWQDMRSAPARLKRLPGFPRLADAPWRVLHSLYLHGLAPVAAGMSVNHMRYIRFARPEIYAATRAFLEPMDYLALRLTGRIQATQLTAYMGMGIDNRAGGVARYHPSLLRYALIDENHLPPLLPPDGQIGPILPDVAAALGLPPDIPVITGLNDTQTGAMGTASFSGTGAALSIGTTSTLVSHRPSKKTDIGNSLFCLPSPQLGQHLGVAEIGIAGGAMESFVRNTIFAEDDFANPATEQVDHYAALQRAVGRIPAGAGGLLYLPWLTGTSAPKSDSLVRGAFLNLTPQTTRSHMARAVLEGLALNIRWAAQPMQRFAGFPFTHYAFYGGGARMPALAQILADVLGQPVRALANPQYVTATGAALVAFQRLGLLDYPDFAARVAIAAEYTPNPAHAALYAERFAAFTAAYDAMRLLARRGKSKHP